MKKINLFKTFDSFFRIMLIFLLCFVWCRYYIYDLWLCFFITLIATLCIDLTINFISKKLRLKNNIKEEEIKQIDEYTNSFIFSDDNFSVNFFYNLAKTKHEAIKKSKFIQLDNQKNRIILYPYFMYREFNIDDLINIFNKVKNQNPTRIVICTNTININTIKLAKKLPIEIFILDKIETYEELLKKYNYYPEKTKLKTEIKPTFKDLLSYALNKKRTKNYFLASVLLLFSSFIVPYKIYYLVFASILLILSFVSFVNPKFNKINNIKLLEN